MSVSKHVTRRDEPRQDLIQIARDYTDAVYEGREVQPLAPSIRDAMIAEIVRVAPIDTDRLAHRSDEYLASYVAHVSHFTEQRLRQLTKGPK